MEMHQAWKAYHKDIFTTRPVSQGTFSVLVALLMSSKISLWSMPLLGRHNTDADILRLLTFNSCRNDCYNKIKMFLFTWWIPTLSNDSSIFDCSFLIKFFTNEDFLNTLYTEVVKYVSNLRGTLRILKFIAARNMLSKRSKAIKKMKTPTISPTQSATSCEGAWSTICQYANKR
jgi:hypothetical protein